MRRRLNNRFLVCLVAGLTLVGSGVHLLHTWQVRRNLGTLLDLAEHAKQEGKPERALDYFDLYLRQCPDDLDVRTEYGQALDRFDHTPTGRRNAYQAFDRVLAGRPDRADLRRRAAELAILLNRLPDAVRHLEVLLDTPGADKSEAAYFLARCHELLGALPKAAAWYRRAIAFAPNNLEGYIDLARLDEQRLGQPDVAAQVLDEMVTANARSPRAYLARAERLRQADKKDQAERDVRKAQELKPDDPNVVLAVARMERDRGEPGAAETALRRGLKGHSENVDLYRALADVCLQGKRRDEAVACLHAGVKAASQGKNLLPQLADLLAEAGDPAEADRVIAKLPGAGYPGGLAGYFRARLHMREGKWAAAAALLEKAEGLERYWAGRAKAALSRCYEHLHDVDQQLRTAGQAVLLFPTPETRLALALAQLVAGQVDDAEPELNELTRSERPPAGAWTACARAQLLRVFRTLPKDPAEPQFVTVYLPTGVKVVQVTRDPPDWNRVERATAQAEKYDGTSVELTLIRAELLAAQQKGADAAALLAKRCAESSGEIRLWVARSELAERHQRREEALRLLDEAEKRAGDHPEIRAARVRYWGRHPGKESGPALKRLEQDVDRLSPHDRAYLFDELATAWYRVGDAGEAERLLREQARFKPHGLRPRLMLLDLALQRGGEAALVPLVKELRRLEGEDGVLWRYGEAARLVLRARAGDRSGLAEARRLSDDLNKRAGLAPVALLAAELDELEGLFGRAIENYQLAIKRGEREPAVIKRLAELLVERRRYEEADRALSRLEEQGPPDKELARLGADVALRLHDYPRAVWLAHWAVPGVTRDYRDQVWLGRVLAAAGQSREAEDVLRRCAGKSGGLAEPWIALAEVLARVGQWTRAEKVMEEIKKSVAPKRQPTALARVYEAIDRCDLAEELYQAATRSSLDDFLLVRQAAAFHLRQDQHGKAEKYLRRLLEQRVGAPEEFTLWARRQLALLLAKEKGSPRRDEALTLLDLNLRQRPDALADVRARALVLASRPGQRREALGQFEATLTDRPAAPDELLILAELYEADGDASKAQEQTIGLLALDGRNPQYLAHHIRGLLRRGQTDEAEIYLAQLVQVQPRAARTRELGELLSRAKSPPATP
jgi:tetratricopeptide (TPR) repeat protein